MNEAPIWDLIDRYVNMRGAELFLCLFGIFGIIYGVCMLVDFGYSLSELWDWGFFSMWGSAFTCGCVVTLFIQRLKYEKQRKNKA